MIQSRVPSRWKYDDPDLFQYDPVAAHLCAWCCYYSYYDDVNYWFKQLLGAEAVYRFAADPATGRPQGVGLKLPDVNVIAFSGVTDYSQLYGVIRDSFYLTSIGGVSGGGVGSVWGQHAIDLYNAYAPAITALVQDKPTLFTGHSLGAAIAETLRVILLVSPPSGGHVINGYSFGCPRLSNARFRNLTYSAFNCYTDGDIVTQVPPYGYVRAAFTLPSNPYKSVSPTDPFVNHGRLVRLKPNGEAFVYPEKVTGYYKTAEVAWDHLNLVPDADRLDFGGVLGKRVVDYWKAGLQEHFMDDYLKRCEKNIPEMPTDAEEFGRVAKAAEVETLPPSPPMTTIEIMPHEFPTPLVFEAVRPLKVKRKH